MPMNPRLQPAIPTALGLLIFCLTLVTPAYVQGADGGSRQCGKEGVWIQILGAGGADLNDQQAGSSYLVWIDNQARLLVDTGPGTALRFEESGAAFRDLDAVVFTHLHADHSTDFPAFVQGSALAERDRPLPVFGPEGAGSFPDTETFVARLIGPGGAFPHLQDFLSHRSSGGFKINPRNVPATGQRRWARFGNEHLRLSAVPVHHGDVPAIAWRAEIGEQSIVFSGDFNNAKNIMPEFAAGADVLIVSHAVPESARGEVRELHVTPSQIGRIASQADVRMLILSHRTDRTRGRETQSREVIESVYSGPVIFANDLECWGL